MNLTTHTHAPRRYRGAIALLAVLAGALLWASAAHPEDARAACKDSDKGPARVAPKRAERAILCLANKTRHKRGLKPFRVKRSISKAAGRHTSKMQKENCFSHNCPGEPDLVGRLEKTGYLPCGCRWGAGENLAYGYGRKGSARRIFDAWMNSPPHRSALLSTSFRHVGVGFRKGTPFKRRANAGTFTMDFGFKR